MPSSREETINQIIALESRISQCCRCKPLARCTAKPSSGKGELDPELMIIFESENQLTQNSKNIIELRGFIQSVLGIKGIYHSYLVRCHSKSCIMRDNFETYTNYCPPIERYLNNKNICCLKQEPCSAILLRPTNAEMILCLPFLLEEILILNPRLVFLLGQKTAEHVLQSLGIFEEIIKNRQYERDGRKYIFIKWPGEGFSLEELKALVYKAHLLICQTL